MYSTVFSMYSRGKVDVYRAVYLLCIRHVFGPPGGWAVSGMYSKCIHVMYLRRCIRTVSNLAWIQSTGYIPRYIQIHRDTRPRSRPKAVSGRLGGGKGYPLVGVSHDVSKLCIHVCPRVSLCVFSAYSDLYLYSPSIRRASGGGWVGVYPRLVSGNVFSVYPGVCILPHVFTCIHVYLNALDT